MESPLRLWRESLKITQFELADLAGVSQSHITQVENGHINLGEKLEAFMRKTGGDALEVLSKHKNFIDDSKEQIQTKIKG